MPFDEMRFLDSVNFLILNSKVHSIYLKVGQIALLTLKVGQRSNLTYFFGRAGTCLG
jgi:hypothetical protein